MILLSALDDKEEMTKALMDFTRLREFKFCAAPETDEFLIETRRAFKRKYDDEEYKEIEARAKLQKEWYDLLPRVKEPKPDTKFE